MARPLQHVMQRGKQAELARAATSTRKHFNADGSTFVKHHNPTPAGLKAGEQYVPHQGARQRKRALMRLAKAELAALKDKHGMQVGLDGRTAEGVVAEPVRAQNFDNGVVDLTSHEQPISAFARALGEASS